MCSWRPRWSSLSLRIPRAYVTRFLRFLHGASTTREQRNFLSLARLLAERQKASSIFFFSLPSIKTAKIIARCQHLMLHAGGDARERIKIAFNIKTLKVLQNSTFPFPSAPVSIIFLFCYHRIFYGRPNPRQKGNQFVFNPIPAYFDNSRRNRVLIIFFGCTMQQLNPLQSNF